MKIKIVPWLFVLAAAAFCSGQDKAASAAAKKSAPKSLLRMDLLQMKARPAAAVKRDIFLPEGSSGPAAMSGRGMMMAGRIAPPAAPETASLEPTEPPFSGRYIGYIRGLKKITALVLFENQAAALEEGDMLGSIWKVVRITVEAVEIQGQGGASRTLPLEGERK